MAHTAAAAAKSVGGGASHVPAPDTAPSQQSPAARASGKEGAKGEEDAAARQAPSTGAGEGDSGVGGGGGGGVGTTLYVKNLNFDTKEEALKRAMAQGGKVKAVTILTKPNPKAGAGARLSMGYGFVEFASSKEAATALAKLQGAELDGHKLQIKMSSRVAAGASGGDDQAMVKVAGKRGAGKGDETNTRLVVRNVPFEATRKELRVSLPSRPPYSLPSLPPPPPLSSLSLSPSSPPRARFPCFSRSNPRLLF